MNNSRGESIRATEAEMQELINDAMDMIKDIAMQEIKNRAARAGMRDGDLYDSFKMWGLKEAKNIVQEIYLSFNLYGRWKDMKYVNYSNSVNVTNPSNRGKKYKTDGDDNINAITGSKLFTSKLFTNSDDPEIVRDYMTWIMGVRKDRDFGRFKYVPGYTTNGSNRMPVTARAVHRLAWTMAISRMKSDRVRNKQTLKWYNTAKSMIANKAGAELRTRLRTLAKNAVKNSLETIDINTKI